MPRALPREWYGEGIRNFGVRRERARLGPRALLAWAAAVAVLLGSLLLYVSQGIQVIRMGYELDRLQDRYRALKGERERLEVELASRLGLQEIAREAVERFGMVFPEPGQIVVVRTAGADRPAAGAGDPARRVAAAR